MRGRVASHALEAGVPHLMRVEPDSGRRRAGETRDRRVSLDDRSMLESVLRPVRSRWPAFRGTSLLDSNVEPASYGGRLCPGGPRSTSAVVRSLVSVVRHVPHILVS